MATRSYICPQCAYAVTGTVRGVAVWDSYDIDEDEYQGPPVEWALVQCDRCHRVCVQVREDYGGDNGFDDDDDPGTVFPAPRRLSWDIPDALRDEWEEARKCFDAKAYTAAAVMVRRTLEGACQDNGVRERNLQRAVAKMRDKGVLDGALSSWADALRLLGNRSAHYTGEHVSREDAADALDFAEALLDHVYVFRKRFERFMQRTTEPSEVDLPLLAEAEGDASQSADG